MIYGGRIEKPPKVIKILRRLIIGIFWKLLFIIRSRRREFIM